MEGFAFLFALAVLYAFARQFTGVITGVSGAAHEPARPHILFVANPGASRDGSKFIMPGRERAFFHRDEFVLPRVMPWVTRVSRKTITKVFHPELVGFEGLDTSYFDVLEIHAQGGTTNFCGPPEVIEAIEAWCHLPEGWTLLVGKVTKREDASWAFEHPGGACRLHFEGDGDRGTKMPLYDVPLHALVLDPTGTVVLMVLPCRGGAARRTRSRAARQGAVEGPYRSDEDVLRVRRRHWWREDPNAGASA